MTDLQALRAANAKRWNAASVTPGLIHLIDGVSQHLVVAKPRYQAVEAETSVPWAVIAVIHERESSQSWQASLAQGDRWDHVSIHVPAHRGPFSSWEAAAEDALVICPPHAANWHDWTIGGALTLLEQYNGLGYASGPVDHATGHQYPPQASPYIWASTDQYHSGKYIADGHFDPNAIDHQIGCAALLARMTLIDPTIAQEWHS
jgi:lysozyme family protein